MQNKNRTFTVLILFTCLSIIGVALLPLLTVQLTPSKNTPTIHVKYEWNDASAKIIEQEVTSKLEGVFNTIKGVKKMSSNSKKGKGSIGVIFKKNSDLDAIRFEMANLIRQAYASFPEGVSYPRLSLSNPNENQTPILSYSINANESPYYIKKYVENNIESKLTTIKGVNQVIVYGATPYEWCIVYDTSQLMRLSISVKEIESAINTYLRKQELGTVKQTSNTDSQEQSLILIYKEAEDLHWEKIPIKQIGNRIIRLKDIAEIRFKEGSANAFYRINGLNSINLVVYAEKQVNTLKLTKEVRSVVAQLEKELAPGYSLKLTQDTTEYVEEELQKIEKRTLFSLVILLLLILSIYRSFEYVLVLFLSIATNLLIAIIFYYAFNVELQLYSFAGITISFGIIIDNSIIMIDHLLNKGDKKAFLAILAATLTTIGALLVVFLLEEKQRANLWDFALVIAINIGVSLLVSLYYVPALLMKLKLQKKRLRFSRKRKRRILKFTRGYAKLIFWLKKPLLKWSLILLLVFGFGIPFHLLPKKIEKECFYKEEYNKTIGSDWFAAEVRPVLEKAIGGTLRLFTEEVFESSYYAEPERTKLTITGRMPEGCTLAQLNEVVSKMENFISSFEEVQLYETQVNSPQNSRIQIYFKKEYEYSSFPFVLKSRIESKAISLGGLDWSVSGVGRGFSNALNSDYKSNRIVLTGYNYNRLYKYAEMLKIQLIENSNSRIKEVEITNGEWRDSKVLHEYYLEFNNEKLSLSGISQKDLYAYLKNQVHSGGLSSVVHQNEIQKVQLVSSQHQKFNVWDLKNAPISIKNEEFKLHQLASIEKKKTGNAIAKSNQQYKLVLAYNFIGTATLAKKVREKNIEILKQTLPVGYRVYEPSYNYWNKKDASQYYNLFLVLGIIFFVCSVLLESLKQPLVILSMIPISFIGVFLTFYLFEFNFDQGGYASFILLAGISVNSALYIINDWNNLQMEYPMRKNYMLYFKAFNYKIIPVVMTIISTIAGLIPFIWDGQKEVFWFSFAVGTIGGLFFSLIAIFVYLPLFSIKKY